MNWNAPNVGMTPEVLSGYIVEYFIREHMALRCECCWTQFVARCLRAYTDTYAAPLTTQSATAGCNDPAGKHSGPDLTCRLRWLEISLRSRRSNHRTSVLRGTGGSSGLCGLVCGKKWKDSRRNSLSIAMTCTASWLYYQPYEHVFIHLSR